MCPNGSELSVCVLCVCVCPNGSELNVCVLCVGCECVCVVCGSSVAIWCLFVSVLESCSLSCVCLSYPNGSEVCVCI